MAGTTSVTVYGVKQGGNWLTAERYGFHGLNSRLVFRPWDELRVRLTSVRTDAERWVAEHGGVVEPKVYSAAPVGA
jgi:hypothetical protein